MKIIFLVDKDVYFLLNTRGIQQLHTTGVCAQTPIHEFKLVIFDQLWLFEGT